MQPTLIWILVASVYTEMNAISKGVSLGIFDEKRNKGIEAQRAGSQPYVDLMGRRFVIPPKLRVPKQWNGLSPSLSRVYAIFF
jgi:hypothetical protein